MKLGLAKRLNSTLPLKGNIMTVAPLALFVCLTASLLAPASAQPAQGQGPGPGPGGKMLFNKDNTPGWQLMTPDERVAYGAKMRDVKSYAECKAMQDEQHKAMQIRAKEKGVTLSERGVNGCERMKARGLIK